MRFLIAIIFSASLVCCHQLVKEEINSNTVDYQEIKKELIIIYEDDQGIRNFNVDSIGDDSGALHTYYRKMREVDSINQLRLLPILEKYGWPPESKIGEKASKAIYFVIQHSNSGLIEKYLPQMEKLAQEGEASATDAATMRDRLLMFQGKKQVYGTQASNWVREDASMVVWPIANVEEVNMRRQEVGFPTTVEENAKRLNAIFDPGEKLPQKETPPSN